MARYNPELMGLDDDATGTRQVFGTKTDTPKITDAEAQAAAMAAAKELAMTPYAELTPAQREAMTQAEKTAYIKAARDEQDALNAEARAASNPMFDFTNRPDAPPPSAISGENYIYYYSWMGDTNSGQWKLYRAPNTQENLAKYGSRSIGGPTQAVPGNPSGANALVVQPQPIKDAKGNITGWSVNGYETISSTSDTSSILKVGSNIFQMVNGILYFSGVPFTGTDGGKTYKNGLVVKPEGDTGGTDDTSGITDSTTFNLVKSLQDQIALLTRQSTTNTAADKAAADAAKYNERISIYSSMADRFNKYGLTGLANKIKELAIAGATEATITLQLQETPEYQQRFAANADRLKKGLSVLTPAEYVNVEDSYRQVLRAYGLKQFDNDAYVRQFIANDMSPTELSNRVVTAVQRVQNADPAIINQLKQYYGIGASDMVAYVLDPEQQFQKIERQIAASEIGVAAGRQGLTAGVSVAEQLAAQGVSQAEAQKGYATIADILPTAEKLSDIYGTTLGEYRQAEGEQEVFNSLASAQRKRQKLTAREIAAFSGASGTNRTSLTTSAVGQY